LAAAQRRLREELGLGATLDPAFTFLYRKEVGGGLVEHEFDHVFLGRDTGTPRPDPAEVSDCWRVSPETKFEWAARSTPM
jgi:isopentenyl-diphosphate delta-isomerase